MVWCEICGKGQKGKELKDIYNISDLNFCTAEIGCKKCYEYLKKRYKELEK